MKKILSYGLALASAVTISGNALALDVSQVLITEVDDVFVAEAHIRALGTPGNPLLCDYKLTLRDPFYPNRAVDCKIRERINQGEVSSCAEARQENIETVLKTLHDCKFPTQFEASLKIEDSFISEDDDGDVIEGVLVGDDWEDYTLDMF